MGLITTYAADFAVSDSCRRRNSHRRPARRSTTVHWALTPPASRWRILFDLARKHGRATGLISNAAISGHLAAPPLSPGRADPQDSQNIAAQLVDAGNIDVILGGGEADFLPEHKEGRRKDGRDLLLEMQRRRLRSSFCTTSRNWKAFRRGARRDCSGFSVRQSGVCGRDPIRGIAASPGGNGQRRRFILLQYNRKGYLLVDRFSGLAGKTRIAKRRGTQMLRELLALDEAVASAISFAGEKLSHSGLPESKASAGFVSTATRFGTTKASRSSESTPRVIPSLTWSTGPELAPALRETDNGHPANEPSAVPGAGGDRSWLGIKSPPDAWSGFKGDSRIQR